MSTLSTVRTAILNNLDRNGVGTTETNNVTDWINQVIREDLCSDHNWSFLEKTRDITTVDGTEVYTFVDVSSDATQAVLFKDCKYIRFRANSSEDYRFLTELNEEALLQAYTEQTGGYPLAWARTYTDTPNPADAFRLRLVPDGAYQIRVHYWCYPDELVNDADTNVLLARHQKLLEIGVTARALLYYGEEQKAQLWLQLFDREYAKAINNDRRAQAVANGTFRVSTVAGRPAAGQRGTLSPFRQAPYSWNS